MKKRNQNPDVDVYSHLLLIVISICCLFAPAASAQVYSVTNLSDSFVVASSPGAGSSPYSVAAADVNGDGHVDLICANELNSTLTVLTNNGSGGFSIASSPGVGNGPRAVTTAYVNGDVKIDLISANELDSTLSVLTNNGSGGFVLSGTNAVGNSPFSVVAVDVNGDGHADLISANYGANTLTVLTNNGSGIFGSNATLNVGSNPESIIAADVNGDGHVDLISANYGTNTLTVLTNNGSGKFGSNATVTVGNGPNSVTAADVNGDGKIDLICANYYDSTLTVLTNNGSGKFGFNATLTVGGNPTSVTAFTNVYGRLDLICANYAANSLTLLTNNGSGIFGSNATYSVGNGPISVTAADVNGDGRMDLICENYGSGTLSVLTNATTISYPLQITGFSPTNGVSGTSVIINGPYNFSTVTNVLFNGQSAAFSINSNTQITATVPLLAATGYITLFGTGGSAVSTNMFYVPPPVMTGYSPTNGPEGTTVIVSGTNFNGILYSTVNSVPAYFVINNNSQVTVTVPDCAGSGPIVLTAEAGSTISATNFIYTKGSIVLSLLTQAGLNDALCNDTNVTFSVNGTAGLASSLNIASDITFDGTGQNVTISGNNSVGVFTVNPGVHLTLKNLTIANGRVSSVGAGIYNNGGFVTLQNCTFSNNAATGASGGYTGAGGGIYNFNGGTVTITGSTFVSNSATGGIGSTGLYASGTGFVGGTGTGGAICNDGSGNMFITNCTFYGNLAVGGQGGMGGQGENGYLYYYVCGEYCCDSGFFGCEEDCPDYCDYPVDYTDGGQGGSGGNAYGGNIYNNSGSVIVVNDTVAGGSIAGGSGGVGGNPGLYAPGNYGPGSSGSGAGGNIGQGSGSYLFINTIVVNPVQGGNFFGGAVTDGGNNLSSDATLALTNSASFTNTNPDLGSLTNNGGATMTMALQPGSPAINAGNNSVAPATDQRGLPRTVCGTTDIGAFELQEGVTLTLLGANPLTNQCFAPFTDPGATAFDTCAGYINGTIVVTSNVKTNLPGIYAITYTVTSGGTTNSVTRTVIMQGATIGTTSLLEAPSAGTDSVVVAMTPESGTWTATTNTTWLHLNPANQSGTGSTNVVFSFDANPGATRSGTLTIGGQTLTITQAGSAYVAANPVTTIVPAADGVGFAQGVAVDGAGNVYIAATGAGKLMKWTAANNTVTTLVSSGLGTPSPYGLAVDGSGNVYMANTASNAILEWTTSNSNVVTLVSSGLSSPYGVAVDGAGNVYIADTSHNAIKEWTASNSNVVTLVSSGLNAPTDVTVDSAGNVYIADLNNGAIKEWTAANSNVTTLVSSGLNQPYTLAVDNGGNVYISDFGNNALKEWSAVSSNVTTLVSSGLSTPYGVAVDGSRNVYLCDSGNGAIKELPYAFVNPAPVQESPGAGSDVLPAILPTTINLLAPFTPTNDQPWLTIGGIANGVVSFSFTANTGSIRTAHITVLGQSIPVTQTHTVSPPVITMPSNIVAEATSAAGAVVNFTTTATNSSGTVTTTNIPASGSTFSIGLTTVTVTATDTYGNSATNTFTVTVQDTNVPVITLLGGNPLTNYIHTVFIDPGATATDTIAGNLNSAIIVTGTVNTNVAGAYVLTYTVSDTYGNTASTNRSVIIQIPTAPQLSIALSRVSGLMTNGSGNFITASSPGAGSSPVPLAAFTNADGYVDLLCGDTGNNQLELLTNNGSGTFGISTTYSLSGSPYAMVEADVNGDGKMDVICGDYYNGTLSVFTNNGIGGFALASQPSVGGYSYPRSLAVFTNFDGKVDIITANYTSYTLTLLSNNGGGSFGIGSIINVAGDAISVAAGDFNGDGKADLVYGDWGSGGSGNLVTVLTNNGVGGFVVSGNYTVGYGPIYLTTADVNGDGKLDIISLNYIDRTLTVLTNNGSGGFASSGTYGVASYPFSVTVADVNGDDKPDLICANAGTNTLTVLTNNGSGGFALAATLTVGSGPNSSVVADVNHDGRVDLICADGIGNTLTVLTNSVSVVTNTVTGVVISWPSPSTGFVLQQNGSLITTNWANFGGTVNSNSSTMSVTNAPAAGNLFFRLANP